MNDIHDIKAPIDTPISFTPLWILLAAVFVVVVSYIIWKYFYKYAKKPEKQIFKEHITPKNEYVRQTLMKLQKLEKDFNDEISEEFYKKLSEIIWWFLEKIFAKPFMKMTTEEILKIEEIYSKDLESVLQNCDLVKFADKDGSIEEGRELLKKSRKFVESVGF